MIDKFSEQELIDSARTNPEKFGLLYDKYIDPIYRYIFRRVNDKTTAEDLTGKTFLDAFSHLDQYEYTGAPFSCWLYRVARNNLTDWYRKNHRLNIVAIDEYTDSVALSTAHAQLKNLSDQEQKEGIIKALELMEESDGEIIILKYFEELSNREIAEVLEISANHVGVKLFRALKKLRVLLVNENLL